MDEVDQNELIDLDISQADLALFLGAASAIRSSTPVGAKSSTGDGGVLDSNASDAAQASENVLPSYIKAGQRGEQIIPAFLVKTYEVRAPRCCIVRCRSSFWRTRRRVNSCVDRRGVGADSDRRIALCYFEAFRDCGPSKTAVGQG